MVREADRAPNKNVCGWHWFNFSFGFFFGLSVARNVSLDVGYGETKEEAKRKVEANYLYRAGRITNQEWFRIQIGADG